MSFFIFANNVNTTLANAVAPGDTSITLASTLGLPAAVPAGQVLAITLNDLATRGNFEIVYATSITGATLTVLRAQEGTVAQSWLGGDFVFNGPTAAQMVFAATNSQFKVQSFTSSGPFVVPIGVTTVFGSGCAAAGGGAGGGGAIVNAAIPGTTDGFGGAGGGGGGAGQPAINIPIAVIPGETLTVVIPAGGPGGAAGTPTVDPTNGGAGGNLQILRGAVPILTLTGGSGGTQRGGSYKSDSRAGVSGGDGGAGFPRGSSGTNSIFAGGNGGAGASSAFGGGGGGGTASTFANPAGPGAAGDVGAGGGGGGGGAGGPTAGVNGFPGGAGGKGQWFFQW